MAKFHFPKKRRRRFTRYDPIEIIAGLIWRSTWQR